MTGRRRTALLALAGIVAITACRAPDCILIGTPAVLLSARDAGSGQPVSLAGAGVTYTDASGTHAQPSQVAEVTICCTRGEVRLRVQQQGYAPWDSTVAVRTQGACGTGTPVPVAVVAMLRPVDRR